MMTIPFTRSFALFVCLAVFSLSAMECRAQEFSRKNWIVMAVEKTKDSVVSIKLPNSRFNSNKSVGTGVIIDERGFIVTNRHVVGSHQQVSVNLADGTELAGQVLLVDPSNDLAILRVSSNKQLKALILAPTNDLMQGEYVLAIGHPYGYQNTVSRGIISHVNRSITMPTGEVLSGLIQTDAAINPGNSGGPLLNVNGELIGINVAMRDGAQLIAFAINSGTVRNILTKHMSSWKVAGVGHGIYCQEKVVAETGNRQKVVVAGIYQQSPAAKAGLVQGDEIIQVGNLPVCNRFDLERSLWDKQPGQQVNLKVVREGKQMNVTLTLENLTQAYPTAALEMTPSTQTAQVSYETPASFKK